MVVAGSLLEFALQEAPLSMPVGRVEHLWLAPMAFEEFLIAVGDAQLIGALRTYELNQPWAASLHQRFMARQRKFLVVGGMPEVVATFIEEGSRRDDVRRVQDEILSSYVDDFAKYRGCHPIVRMQRVFRAIPGTLGQKTMFADRRNKRHL